MAEEDTAKIEVFGCHNINLDTEHPEYWCVSGAGKGDQGVELRPKLTGAIDAPVKSLWLPGAFGQVFVDFRWQRRDMVFTVFIFGPQEDTPSEFHTVDALWRQGWDYVDESTIRYTYQDETMDEPDVRTLKARMLEEPKSYDADSWEGKDPHLFNCANIVMTVAAELPFYVGEPIILEWYGSGANGTKVFPIQVDCDVPVWPRWTLTDRAIWTLPDYSWGNEEYGRGIVDKDRAVPLPFLPAGAGTVADSDPRKQTLLAANRIHLQGLWGGKDLLYPIAPGTNDQIVVQVEDAVDGWYLRLEIARWYTRPWGRPADFAPLVIHGPISAQFDSAGAFDYEIPSFATKIDMVVLGAGGGGAPGGLLSGAGGGKGVYQTVTLERDVDIPLTTTHITGTVGAGGAPDGDGGDTVANATGMTTVTATGGNAGASPTSWGQGPGNITFNDHTYLGGAIQFGLGVTGKHPGGGGGGGFFAGLDGGPGADGSIWFYAY